MIKKVFANIAVSLLCVILCLGIVLSFISGFCSLFLNEEKYAEQVANENYISSIEAILYDRLEGECLYYDIPFEYIKQSVKKDELKSLSDKYIHSLIVALKTGGEFPKISYDRAFVRAEIDRYLTDNPDIGMYYEEETKVELTEGFSKAIDNVLNSFFNKSIITDTARAVYSNRLIGKLADAYYWIIASVGLSAALIAVLSYKKIFIGLYKIFASAWCGSVLVFIPVKIIQHEDIISGLIIEKGPFKTLIDGIYGILMDYSVKCATLYFIITSLLLLASIVILSIYRKKDTQNAPTPEEGDVNPEIQETVADNEAC